MTTNSTTARPWYEVANASEIPSPALLIYRDRVTENIARMIRYCGDVKKLRPHVKTHKLPQIVAMKLAAGISKFKASTIAEAEMTAGAGGNDVLLALQPVGPQIGRLFRLIQHFPQSKFSAIVDDVNNLRQIAKVAQEYNQQLPLYIDLNVGMNRTGIELGPKAIELYRTMCSIPGIVAAGVHAYDGHLHEPDRDSVLRKVAVTYQPVWQFISELTNDGLPVPNIVTSGTPTSQILAEQYPVEVGAGTTALWDFGQAEVTPYLDYQYAAVLLARVISRPTKNRICLDLGHKAVASEMPQPRVRFFGLEDATAVLHSEEHLVLETDRADLYPVGTVCYGVPRHICPTVALQSEVWCVGEGRAIETWPVVARARRLTI
jgi:D-serine deaminase-like pyridoxal phosphate-dependent protein